MGLCITFMEKVSISQTWWKAMNKKLELKFDVNDRIKLKLVHLVIF